MNYSALAMYLVNPSIQRVCFIPTTRIPPLRRQEARLHVAPDLAAYNALVAACARSGQWQRAEHWATQLRAAGKAHASRGAGSGFLRRPVV